MMIQLPGSAVPVQVKGILANSAIPITLSTVAGNPAPSAVVPAPESHSGRLLIFLWIFLHVCREGYPRKNEAKLFFLLGGNSRCCSLGFQGKSVLSLFIRLEGP